ncbi:MAG: aminotransferase class IV [bacterium]
MTKTVTTINGRFVEKKDALISVFDNSLLYAEGLFETFLAIDDRVIFVEDHLKRLYKGAKVIGLDIPVSSDKLIKWMIKTARLHPDKIKKLRMTITSGEAARWTGKQGKPQIILSASPHKMPEKPFALLVSQYRVDQDSIFRRIKTISYAIHAAALKQAHGKKYDDALMLNEKGNVAEVTSANIFWVNKGQIFTPPLMAGCLEGVTRKAVLTESKKLGFKISERDVTLAKILKADEIFISSSLKLVIGVGKIIEGRQIHSFPTGPITLHLSNHFRKFLSS